MENCQNTDKSEKRKLNFEVAYNVVRFLAGLPKDIKNIFTPKNENDLLILEMNLIKFSSREKEREKVINIQRDFGLPLRPNQSLREVLISIRVLTLKKKVNSAWNSSTEKDNQDKDNKSY